MAEIFTTIIHALYFILPAYVANMLPSIFSKTNFLKSLAVPIDGNMKMLGKPLLGSHKTVRGFLLGIGGAVLFALLQYALDSTNFFSNISIVDYSAFGAAKTALFGLLLGSGALLGDAFKSLAKRQLGIKPGGSFIPFDQLDYIVGSLLLSTILFKPPSAVVITLLIISPLLHIMTNIVAFRLKLKDVWW